MAKFVTTQYTDEGSQNSALAQLKKEESDKGNELVRCVNTHHDFGGLPQDDWGEWRCEIAEPEFPLTKKAGEVGAKVEGTLGELEEAVPKVSERFKEAAPLLQSALMRGVGESYMSQRGVAGRGSPASRAGMASLAASQADAETKAATKMADYSIDAAAQDVEQFSYLYDLAAAEERKMGQVLSQVQADLARIRDDNPADLEAQSQEMRALRASYEEQGNDAAVAAINRALDVLEHDMSQAAD